MKSSFPARIAGALFLAAAALSSHASVIDFSGVQGENRSPLVLPSVTITSASGVVLVGARAADRPDGFCFLLDGFCASDGRMDFASAISNLHFGVTGASRGDSVLITAFDGAALRGSVTVIFNGQLDFSSFGDITSLVFDDSSTQAGVAYTGFEFDRAAVVTPPNTVPEPGSFALVGLGVAGLSAVRRRRKQA